MASVAHLDAVGLVGGFISSGHAGNPTLASIGFDLGGAMAGTTQPPGAAQPSEQPSRSDNPSDNAVQRTRAWTGLWVVAAGDVAIAVAAIWGVVKTSGSATNSPTIAILTSAFTAIGTMTTAYFGIKSMSNTAQSFAPPSGANPGPGTNPTPGANLGPPNPTPRRRPNASGQGRGRTRRGSGAREDGGGGEAEACEGR